ncbi:helix-turn-helix domain-containing protein [Mesorhizobium xinjiangense]|uniref:helix-turn-helix domain-containing protein n=1 Tax=Mesorhizobium xinjiangense TaxID=2678685 RepID=UPI0012EDDF43|nr:helix-turn-helix domain-containing protein [Mesorhizobium xinjiangense]
MSTVATEMLEPDRDLRPFPAPPPNHLLGGSGIPAYEFSTLHFAPGNQFAAWRRNFAPVVELSVADGHTDFFSGKQTIWDLGSFAVMKVKSDTCNFTSLARHARLDPLDIWQITLVLHGRSVTDTPFGRFAAGPGTVQIQRLGTAFSGSFIECELLHLLVPRQLCHGMVHLLEAAEFTAQDQGIAGLFGDYMLNLSRRLPSLDIKDTATLASATRGMIRACFSDIPDGMDTAADEADYPLFQRTHRLIDCNLFAPDLGAAKLLSELYISRSRLYRLFRPYGGVWRYIQRQRLLHAHSVLANPGDRRRILDIADAHGFADCAEFSRAFKREFGYKPSQVRASGRIQPRTRRPGADLRRVEPGSRLGAILRRLQN